MQPYEKFKKLGPESLSDAELLAILLRTGTKDLDAVEIGEKILNIFPEYGLSSLHKLYLQDLMKIPGIGEVKAVRLKCVMEIAKRIASFQRKDKISFSKPQTVAEYYMEEMRHLTREVVLLILLDAKLHRIEDKVISVGTINQSILSPRDVFSMALRLDACHVMLLHNHPSGDATPSKEDMEITTRIANLGKELGIPLVDHIIIGDKNYTSFKELSLI
ncbi:MAG: JAB domain-containing protein [Lachnospiraceae bacterium]|jgi:DNA repair protein RadC|nr:JAB domain-containing protein [Lachnospiraceae bacterium]